jgi:hypothetical protein
LSTDTAKTFEPKRAKNAGRPTWIPEPKTSQYYQELGLDYYEDPREIVNRKNLQKCSYEYDRAIKTIYRIRTNDKHEWITWYEARTGKTQLGSPIKAWVVYCGLNWKPIPTYEVKFDNETQQQTKKVSGIVERKKEYAIEYNTTNIDDLLIEANEFECQYIIMHDERDKFIVDNLADFKGNFETLYKTMFQRKVDVANSERTRR